MNTDGILRKIGECGYQVQVRLVDEGMEFQATGPTGSHVVRVGPKASEQDCFLAAQQLATTLGITLDQE
jgi:hypothetical protein